MSKCIRCNINDTVGTSKICPTCVDKWSLMREYVFDHCTRLYGTLGPNNHKQFIKMTKKLEKMWRKNPDDLTEYLKNEQPI